MSEPSSNAPRRGGAACLARCLWTVPRWRGVVVFGVLLSAVVVFHSGFFTIRSEFLSWSLKQPAAKTDGPPPVIGGAPDATMLGRYNAADLREWANRYTDQGRRYYIASQYQFDVIFPFVYGFALALGIALPREYARKKRPTGDTSREPPLWLLLLPVLAVLFDFAENITVISLVDNLPGGALPPSWECWGNAAGWFTMLKWWFCYASFFAVLVGLVCAYWPKRKESKP